MCVRAGEAGTSAKTDEQCFSSTERVQESDLFLPPSLPPPPHTPPPPDLRLDVLGRLLDDVVLGDATLGGAATRLQGEQVLEERLRLLLGARDIGVLMQPEDLCREEAPHPTTDTCTRKVEGIMNRHKNSWRCLQKWPPPNMMPDAPICRVNGSTHKGGASRLYSGPRQQPLVNIVL